ncbi:MAG: replicative DNA helicase [Ignavibacteriales bacterium]|nr:replicative DNA helicase [Ignavibacteriales bacterium]
MASKKEKQLDINKVSADGKVLPNALDVERAVLGAILLEQNALNRVLDVVNEEVFYSPAHRKIFQAMMELNKRGSPIDLVTVTESLESKQSLEEIGGAYYISELTQSVTSAANLEAYGHILLEKAILRGIISNSNEAISIAYSEKEDALTLLDRTEQRIFELSQHRLKRTAVEMHLAVQRVMEKLDKMHDQHDGITGVPTGFSELDNLTGGFQNSDLIIIAGRPSQGKTAFALNIARNASMYEERRTPVAFFSLEMSLEQLVLRLIASESLVDQNLLRRNKLPNEDWKLVTRAVGRLADSKLFIDDSPTMTIMEIRAKARRLKAEHNIGLIIIDYLQLVKTDERIESREQQIALISRSLKALAKEIDVPVVALSQLNRATEQAKERRPQLSNLRESGAIEQDADVVIFVHRPESYGMTEITDKKGNKIPSEGKAEIIIGKQRNGPTDDILLTFEKRWMSFKSIDWYRSDASPMPTHGIPSREDTPF